MRIAEDETGGSLFDKLAAVGAELCVETMQMLENKTATFTPQDNEASTHTKMISKELGDIDWKKPAVEIERLIRGLNPWPSAYTHLDNKAFKIWKARVVETDGAYAPGCICKVGKNTMVVQTGEGGLELLEVQLAGKKRMDAGSFLRGYPVAEGSFTAVRRREIYAIHLLGQYLYTGCYRCSDLYDCICTGKDNVQQIFRIPQYVRNDGSTGGRADFARSRNL